LDKKHLVTKQWYLKCYW